MGCWFSCSARIRVDVAVQVFRASLDSGSEPECVFEDLDERYNVGISKSADKKLIWIHTGAAMQNEMLYVSSATPEEPFKVCHIESCGVNNLPREMKVPHLVAVPCAFPPPCASRMPACVPCHTRSSER